MNCVEDHHLRVVHTWCYDVSCKATREYIWMIDCVKIEEFKKKFIRDCYKSQTNPSINRTLKYGQK